ncbi:hypothetical protein LTR10_014564 [Elasticomyces elasticus]|nr:hypothetical protein LTR10_014564 [Elasticomyces elasticus]KAK5043033.1 hypothetical protein LTR13_000804 [Exophiala sideris]KAK5186517.1 hypothetical protein LTR44_001573 [Eurotiomycetes sp. CCFEE 6388]
MFAQRSPTWKWLTIAALASVALLLLPHHLSWLSAPLGVRQHGEGRTDGSRMKTPAIMPWNYTSALVMARTKTADVRWVEEEKLEMDKYIYVADDPTAPLHVPANKGNEAMVYLTYIIDHHDSLRDFTVFVHAHRWSGHNNPFLGDDAVQMLRQLNAERVMRDGYMNLRCSSGPGCPTWVHPKEQGDDKLAPIILKEWDNLFPGEPVPDDLAQACCAQFAVSRKQIQSVPLSKYQHWRNWLLETEVSDYFSGRIFEYLWQVLFLGENVFCPDPAVCFCDGFGDLEEWHSLGDQQWKTGARMDVLKSLKADHKELSGEYLDRINGWYKELQIEMDGYGKRRENITVIARQRGQDPKIRAEAASSRNNASPNSRW